MAVLEISASREAVIASSVICFVVLSFYFLAVLYSGHRTSWGGYQPVVSLLVARCWYRVFKPWLFIQVLLIVHGGSLGRMWFHLLSWGGQGKCFKGHQLGSTLHLEAPLLICFFPLLYFGLCQEERRTCRLQPPDIPALGVTKQISQPPEPAGFSHHMKRGGQPFPHPPWR